MKRVALALVHHPVLDRSGETVTTAITNLDLHDMARGASTYGASDLYRLQPVDAQRLLAQRIQDHWVDGSGKRRIPDRAAALDILRIVPTLDDAHASLGGRSAIEVWTTAASSRGGPVTTYAAARARLEHASRTILMLFGTGWGLSGAL